MQDFYRTAANGVALVHFAFVLFVTFGLVAILVGIVAKWDWVRNAWFRWLHLVAIVFVVLESWAGITCPLTVWERELRQLAGQATLQEDFIASWVHRLMFFQAPPWVFTLAYSLFGAAVLLTFLLAPPRRSARPVIDGASEKRA